MSDHTPGHVTPPDASADDELPQSIDFEHPRGTLAIVVIFGALFLLGWLAMYIFRFMGQGVPQH